MLTLKQATNLAFRSSHFYQDQYVGTMNGHEWMSLEDALETAVSEWYYIVPRTKLKEGEKPRSLDQCIASAIRRSGEGADDAALTMEEQIDQFVSMIETMKAQNLIVDEMPDVTVQKKQIEILEVGLKFYADEENWTKPALEESLAVPRVEARKWCMAQGTLQRYKEYNV